METSKSYQDLCKAILGNSAYKIAEVSEMELYHNNSSLELTKYGLTEKESEKLSAALELGRRMFCQTTKKQAEHMRFPADVATYMMPRLRYLNKEQFWVICLNAHNRIVCSAPVSQGSLTNTYVHPREVFEYAILNHAAAICVAHNHPSGSSTPSKDDKKLTLALQKSGEILGIPLLDHIIIGDGCYYSFQEDGSLNKE